MNQPETSKEATTEGVTHRKTEAVTMDYEKMITAASPLISSWQGGETERARLQEEGATKRTTSGNWTLLAIVAMFCALGGVAIYSSNPGIAEKIVIGLLGFLGGMYMRR